MTRKIKIGTRGSPLALAQARETRARLIAAHDGLAENDFEIVVIKTSGDKIQDRLLLNEGGKGLFTKEIEDALLAGEIDFAVHSTKDMPAKLPDGLGIVAFLERQDPRDAFLSPVAKTLIDLPKGAVIGTSSLRRQAQALRLRPDLEVVPFRGNVETRIRKMENGEVAATFLAAAGLNRLGLDHCITSLLSCEDMLPAPGQGAICIEARLDDEETANRLAPLNHPETAQCVAAEREVSLTLGASCRMPLSAFAEMNEGTVHLRAALFSPDGKKHWPAEGNGSDPMALGKTVAKTILDAADSRVLQEFGVS